MINVPPPLVILPNQVAGTTATAVPVINPPANLAAVPAGTVLNATVLGSDPTGAILVRTNQGVFSFNSPLAVNPGATLALTVQGTPGPPQVVPAVVDRGPAPAAAPSLPLPPLANGSVVEAVLVGPNPTAAAAPTATPVTPIAPPPSAPSPVTTGTPPAPTPLPPASATSAPPSTAGAPATPAPAPAAPAASAAPAPPPSGVGSPPPQPPPVPNPGASNTTPPTPPAPPAPSPATASPAAPEPAPPAATPSTAGPAAAGSSSASPPPGAPVPSTPAPPSDTAPAPAAPGASPSAPPDASAAPVVPQPPASPTGTVPSAATNQPSAPPAPNLTAAAPTAASPPASPGVTTAGATGAAPPIPIPLSGPAALVAQQLATAAASGQPGEPVATSGTPPPTGGTVAPGTTPLAPSPLAGLGAGDRVLVRVLALLPPVGDAADGGAAVIGANAAAVSATATRTTAAGTTGVTLADVETAASLPNSSAAQVQTASLSQVTARAGQPGPASPAVLLAQAAAGVSAPVAPSAVQPIVRAAAGPALTADPPPVTAAEPTPAPPAPAAPTPAAATPAGASSGAPTPVATTPVATTATPPTTAAQAEVAANAAAPTAAETEAAPSTTPFDATVVGTSTGGQPILLAGQTLLTLRAASVPTGSTLVLQLAAAPRAAPPPLPGLPATALPSLSELVRAAQTVGGAAQTAMTAVVPQPGPTLASQILFYLTAVNRGDLRSWIGDAARTALDRAGRGATLGKLSSELKQASDSTTRSSGAGEWRAQPPIPMSDGAAIQPIQLFVHRTNPDESGSGGDQGTAKPTRFLLDLNLSRLGTIQLDGLAQPPRFDLILRSAQPLSDPMRTEIRQLFIDMTSARGLNGQVSFQVAPPIVPNVAPAAPRPGILV